MTPPHRPPPVVPRVATDSAPPDATQSPPGEEGDADLLRRLGTDPEAFETFYRRHVDKVVGFAARRVQQPEDVADLVAATFVAVVESSPRFDPRRGAPVPWMLGIAFNLLSAQRRRELGEREAWRRLGGRRRLEPEDHDRLLDRIDAERHPGLAASWAALPPGERAVLELVALDDLTPSEAARVLGISAVAARTRLRRARRRCADILAATPSSAAPGKTTPTTTPVTSATALRRTR